MPVQKSRESLSRDEITEILQTNAELFRSEPEFIDYIVDLAVYLLDAHYDAVAKKRKESEAPEINVSTDAVPKVLRRSDRGALDERYEILRSVSTGVASQRCMVCGSKVGKGRKCPNCGQEML